MESRQFGRAGIHVSKLALGTMNFGEHTDEKECREIMSSSYDHGVNWFDTANSYGGPSNEGASESIIGSWLAEQPTRREKLIISTKVFRRMGDGENQSGLSAYHIRQAVDQSLKRLRTDRIDILFLHHVDRGTSLDETFEALERLMAAGKLLYCGTSNFAAWHIASAKFLTRQRGMWGLIGEQSVYNLAERMAELEVIPACQGLGLGFVAYSPLSNGLLSRIDPSSPRQQRPRVMARQERIADRLEVFFDWCEKEKLAPDAVAIQWLLAQRHVTSVLVGPRSVLQLENCFNASRSQLAADRLAELERIWPGPGGAAPEAYAW